ncbi:MAG: hypothetical protein ABIQ02_14295 [Saprospiraceae bacterium]
MENVPVYISIAFGLTTLLTVWLFYRVSGNSLKTLLILLGWLMIQAKISSSGFYQVTNTIPPRFILMAPPAILFIIGLFITPMGRKYLDTLDVKGLTILHIVRIPVELILFSLFLYKVVPQRMTFGGMNLDILAGLSAPFVYYFGFVKHILNTKVILIWNFICLGLLINIVLNAAFSTPSPFQQFAFDQPNIVIFYFPFVWLPSFVVPIVFLSHLASIRKLIKS